MAVDTAYAGRSYPVSAPYHVGVEKLREFATAVGETAAACHDSDAARASGYADVVAPTTFAFVVTLAAMEPAISDPGLGLDYTRVVHGDQRFAYTRPIVAGDVLTATPTLETVRSAAGNDIVTVRCDVADAGGEPVVSTWTTLVARGTG